MYIWYYCHIGEDKLEKEIIIDLKLSNEQEALIEMHSFLNVMNVLIAEISLLGMNFEKEDELQSVVDHCFNITKALTDKETATEAAKNIKLTQNFILSNIKSAINLSPDDENYSEYQQTIDNIQSIFKILDVRVREIFVRANNPEKWIVFNINELQQNFVNVFNAIVKNSKGRYQIIYNIAEHDEKNYLVNLNFKSIDDVNITIPSVFQDVMRDLIANARKYTDPGGRIDAGLSDDGKNLKFVVQDTGIGIPENEVENIVNFGVRAGNTLDRITRGGGFGLTKAYYVVKQFNGRMWIDSKLSLGTKITIMIPRNY